MAIRYTRRDAFPVVTTIPGQFPGIYCFVGVFFREVDTEEEFIAACLIELYRHPNAFAIGKIKPGYRFERSRREVQARNFRACFAAARETRLPLVIHSCSAYKSLVATLYRERLVGVFPAILHSVSSGLNLAPGAIKLGLYVFLAGIFTEPKSQGLGSFIVDLPSCRIAAVAVA